MIGSVSLQIYQPIVQQMKVGDFILFLLFLKVLSTAVDCRTNVQTVLEIPKKVDCQEKFVCQTDCSEFIKNCPTRYIKEYGTHVTRTGFDPLYFEVLSNSKFSVEPFKRTCVDFEFTSITNKDSNLFFE